ncbi:MAG: HAD-IIIA family hydrolase [Brasilonema angustatum HA4187-MV1]|jgi:HAD superfamily hydrolase (TIGR01662 family)|nr:HAD-IIIA family hydrolase [Brasilonema angustatum HA4187-MV1]
MTTKKLIFCSVDNTLTFSKSGKSFKQSPAKEDIKLIPGVQAGVESFKLHGYDIVGISNQSCVPILKSPLECIEEMQATMNLLPQVSKIYFAPSDGEEVYKVLPHSFVYSRRGNQNSFRKPELGMIQKALEEYGRLDDIWFIGDLLHDEQCAANAKIDYLPAKVWHAKFSGNWKENVYCLNDKQAQFLENVSISCI